MALTIKKKVQNFTLDKGTTFEKTIGAESSASVAVTISSGTVAGAMVKNFSYSPTLRLEDGGELLLDSTDGSGGDVGDNITIEPQSFTTSLTGANCTISLTATQTEELVEGKYYYSLTYSQAGGIIKERLAEGLITVEPSAEINNG